MASIDRWKPKVLSREQYHRFHYYRFAHGTMAKTLSASATRHICLSVNMESHMRWAHFTSDENNKASDAVILDLLFVSLDALPNSKFTQKYCQKWKDSPIATFDDYDAAGISAYWASNVRGHVEILFGVQRSIRLGKTYGALTVPTRMTRQPEVLMSWDVVTTQKGSALDKKIESW